MALAFVVTLEKPLAAEPVGAKGANGKALARESDKLSFAARRAGVPAVNEMLSESREKLVAQLVAEGFDPAKVRVPPEQWFDAAAGLRTVRGLIAFVSANLNDFKQPNPILRDLKGAEATLAAAEAAGVRFHFTSADV
ncbi:MAG TPA: hypothetical protein VK324_13490 [Tepidisphaeraceae bacterium]|nr:hypothetical protein [Tepidisphaeraceae bacterium]